MRKMIVLMSFVVTFMVMMTVAPSSFAYEGTTGDYLTDIGTKAGRGLINVITSPAEIPCNISNDMEGGKWYHFFPGLGKGTVYMLRRILVGACEVGTFVIPMEATLAPVCQMTS